MATTHTHTHTHTYIPPAFRERREERLRAFIRRHSFATLVSHDGPELLVSQLPLLLDEERGPHGTLMGHMARANPQWRHFERGRDVVALFHGPHAYVSPSWYASEVAVPTWNYATVLARGAPRLVDDPEARWQLLRATVDTYERDMDEPWTVERLPGAVADQLVRAIVGFEIPIAHLEGKFKLNQNRPPADRQGVVAALRRRGEPDGLAVAALMEALDAPGGA